MTSNAGTKQPASLRSAKQVKYQELQAAHGSSKGTPSKRPARPNYAQIHARPLPIITYPLPAFIPQNPLSWLRIAFTVVKHYFLPLPDVQFEGYFDPSTRSVHVTNWTHVRALWEMGFFGKGILSRSEPTWLDQEKTRLGFGAGETFEEARDRRRKEREKMKKDRARAEREAIQEQLLKESGIGAITPEATPSLTGGSPPISEEVHSDKTGGSSLQASEPDDAKVEEQSDQTRNETDVKITNQEHLQLSLEEAFFLHYALGVLTFTNLPSVDSAELLNLFRRHSYFPPTTLSSLSPDDPFLTSYVVYHHFRSLGWVIRDGIQFAVDYLLYDGGPVFKHADFAVIIVPSYSHDYWKEPGREKTSVQRRKKGKDWVWLHCVNRVQTTVVKTLVLCYVDVPPPDVMRTGDIGAILTKYRVREFTITRWSPNRNRD